MEEWISRIKKNFKTSQDRQKSYVDKVKTIREFKIGEHVFLKVKEKKISLTLGGFPKSVERYVGPFEILSTIGHVSYELTLPSMIKDHNVVHVSLLKKCVNDYNHVID